MITPEHVVGFMFGLGIGVLTTIVYVWETMGHRSKREGRND